VDNIDLSVLGNAVIVPFVIFFTQQLKKIVPNWNSDLVAFLVSILLCVGYDIYNLPNNTLVFMAFLPAFKFVAHSALIGVATAFTAGKTYDLTMGDKKIAQTQNAMQNKIDELQAKHDEVQNAAALEQTNQDRKVREILGE